MDIFASGVLWGTLLMGGRRWMHLSTALAGKHPRIHRGSLWKFTNRKSQLPKALFEGGLSFRDAFFNVDQEDVLIF